MPAMRLSMRKIKEVLRLHAIGVDRLKKEWRSSHHTRLDTKLSAPFSAPFYS